MRGNGGDRLEMAAPVVHGTLSEDETSPPLSFTASTCAISSPELPYDRNCGFRTLDRWSRWTAAGPIRVRN